MTAPTKPLAAHALDQFRLRRFIEDLKGTAELEIVDEPTDLADVGRLLDSNPRAVWFRKLGAEGAELVGNVAGSRERIARAFGVDSAKLAGEIIRRIGNPGELIEIESAAAPVHQVIERGDDVDLTKYPIHLQHGLDGGLFLSAAMDVSVDPETGFSNTGIRRLMIRNKNETGVGLFSPSDLKTIYDRALARGENLPVAFVIGSHPVDHIASSLRIARDELGLMAALRDAPMPVVKCVTNDVRVPADAELVIEGYLGSEGRILPEGPFGEFLGYYGGVKEGPVFHVTAITRRSDALFQTSTIAGQMMSATDSAQLMSVRTEVIVWQALATAIREPVAIHATAASGGMYNVRIAMRQRVPGEARNAIAAAFGCLANVKHVFVVDPDIDVFSHEQIDWALATRFQADRDLVVVPGFRALPLDPSLDGSIVGAKAGFDLTMPPMAKDAVEAFVPVPPKFEGPRFPSLEAALADGPKTFEDLMSACGSRDGREIVLPLDRLRIEGRVVLDLGGRWTRIG